MRSIAQYLVEEHAERDIHVFDGHLYIKLDEAKGHLHCQIVATDVQWPATLCHLTLFTLADFFEGPAPLVGPCKVWGRFGLSAESTYVLNRNLQDILVRCPLKIQGDMVPIHRDKHLHRIILRLCPRSLLARELWKLRATILRWANIHEDGLERRCENEFHLSIDGGWPPVDHSTERFVFRH